MRALLFFFFGFLFMGCAFTTRVVDRSRIDTPEMMFDNILPDRDLPDITSVIVSEAGGGSGGGAVGGCWN